MNDKGRFINAYVSETDINMDTTCADLLKYRDRFTELVRNQFGNAIGFSGVTEQLLVKWFSNYFKNQSEVKVLTETKYDAAIGRQKLDIPIVESQNGVRKFILIGISVKARTETSGYLDGADFENPLILENKQHLKERKDGRIGVPTFLQDMARIENLQLVQPKRFKSVTIVYDKTNEKNTKWVNDFSSRFNHRYIFLKNHGDQKFEEALGDLLELC